MAKKTQRKAAKTRARKKASSSFMVALPSDLAALVPRAGKGPYKDVSFATKMATATTPGKPRSR